MFSLKNLPSDLFLAKHYTFISFVCFEKHAVLFSSCLKTRFLLVLKTQFLCLRKVKFLKTIYAIIRGYRILNEVPLVGYESLQLSEKLFVKYNYSNFLAYHTESSSMVQLQQNHNIFITNEKKEKKKCKKEVFLKISKLLQVKKNKKLERVLEFHVTSLL